jgi:hypothetical protein
MEAGKGLDLDALDRVTVSLDQAKHGGGEGRPRELGKKPGRREDLRADLPTARAPVLGRSRGFLEPCLERPDIGRAGRGGGCLGEKQGQGQ